MDLSSSGSMEKEQLMQRLDDMLTADRLYQESVKASGNNNHKSAKQFLDLAMNHEVELLESFKGNASSYLSWRQNMTMAVHGYPNSGDALPFMEKDIANAVRRQHNQYCRLKERILELE